LQLKNQNLPRKHRCVLFFLAPYAQYERRPHYCGRSYIILVVAYRLKPVSFRYKAEIDPSRPPSFGLIAEEVENVQSDLVLRDKEGTPYSVRYDQVNAMLLNELLKEHRKVQKQEAMIARLKSTDAKQRPLPNSRSKLKPLQRAYRK
jgi:Chaperone of endosialidase